MEAEIQDVSDVNDIIVRDIWDMASAEEREYLAQVRTLEQWREAVTKALATAKGHLWRVKSTLARLRKDCLHHGGETSEWFLSQKANIDEQRGTLDEFIGRCEVKLQEIKRLIADSKRTAYEQKMEKAASNRGVKRQSADENRYQYRTGYRDGWWAGIHVMQNLIENHHLSFGDALRLCESHSETALRKWKDRNLHEDNLPKLIDIEPEVVTDGAAS